MEYDRLRIEHDGPVARVFLNRPEVRNAFDDRTIAELTGAFRALGEDDGVRVIVLAGDGKVFCAGADVNWMRASMDLSGGENVEDARRMAAMLRTLDECPKPVIGRIHRAAMGGAMGLAACCDVVVAEPEAKFCFSEVRLGIIPAAISTFVLPKIGESAARRYFLTAEVFRSSTAREIGIVHEIVPEAELDAKVQEIVDALLAVGPRAVGEIKRLIHIVRDMDRDATIEYTAQTIARVRASPEGQEGLRAFLEKREPSWKPPESA